MVVLKSLVKSLVHVCTLQLRALPIVGSCSDVSEAGSVDAVRAVLPAHSEGTVTKPAGFYHGPTAWTGGGRGGL